MFCGKCGAQIPDNALFCPVCGQRCETPYAGAYTAPVEPDRKFADGIKTHKKLILSIVIAVAVVAVALILLFTFVIGNSPESVAIKFMESVYPDTSLKGLLEYSSYDISYDDVCDLLELAEKYDEERSLEKAYDKYGTKDPEELIKYAVKEGIEEAESSEIGKIEDVKFKVEKVESVSRSEINEIVGQEEKILKSLKDNVNKVKFTTGGSQISEEDAEWLEDMLEKAFGDSSDVTEMKKVTISGEIVGTKGTSSSSDNGGGLELYVAKIGGKWKVYDPLSMIISRFRYSGISRSQSVVN